MIIQEAKNSACIEVPSGSACSFEGKLHDHYEAIRAVCEAWILQVAEPASTAAANFWLACAFPLFGCATYPECPTRRVELITKFCTWFFFADDEDDDPSLLGSHSVDNPLLLSRHQLILACHSGNPLKILENTIALENSHPRTLRSVEALYEVWSAIYEDMSATMQARFFNAMKDYLNAVKLQAHYRTINYIPSLEEYIAIRRPASLVIVAFILIEYGYGIELDKEVLEHELMVELNNAGVDHIALSNDFMSCLVEISFGDHFNVPSIIFFNARKKDALFTFQDAMKGALDIIDEVDKRCLHVIQELHKTGLIHKPGVEAFVQGMGLWIAGNKTWSLRTARYTHKCPPNQGVVLAVNDPSPLK